MIELIIKVVCETLHKSVFLNSDKLFNANLQNTCSHRNIQHVSSCGLFKGSHS